VALTFLQGLKVGRVCRKCVAADLVETGIVIWCCAVALAKWVEGF
ncbi:hypothetical protein A2U01_0025054, partial [Trifolium medium]|nr:hypothetical protein [Trifolium medium]